MVITSVLCSEGSGFEARSEDWLFLSFLSLRKMMDNTFHLGLDRFRPCSFQSILGIILWHLLIFSYTKL
jgi:hypothetical protein